MARKSDCSNMYSTGNFGHLWVELSTVVVTKRVNTQPFNFSASSNLNVMHSPVQEIAPLLDPDHLCAKWIHMELPWNT